MFPAVRGERGRRGRRRATAVVAFALAASTAFAASSALARPPARPPLPLAAGGHGSRGASRLPLAARGGAVGDYKGLKVAELKGLLKERGLPVSGKKAVLIARLEEADEEAEALPAEPAAATQVSKESGRRVALSAEAEEAPKGTDGEAAGDGGAAQADGAESPFGSTLPDPHRGKPESIVDADGRTRYLCLDGKYRRGDPDSIKCDSENFSEWLTEWVVAARTGQLEGKPQKTFLPKEPENPGNPDGAGTTAGEPMESEEVLTELPPGEDGEPRWAYEAGA